MNKETISKLQVSGEITEMERLPSSRNGNPRFQFIVDGKLFKTAIDASLGYSIQNFHIGDNVTVEYRLFRGQKQAQRVSGLEKPVCNSRIPEHNCHQR